MDLRFPRNTFWLVLAQGFLPPMRAEVARAFVDELAPDLEELAAALDLDVAGSLGKFAAAAARHAQPDALLIEYSRIFLPPNALASLNLSRYVDGSINGPCMDALEIAYARAGLQPGARVRDLPDHISIQMECLGFMAAEKSEEEEADFARLCLVGAMPRLAQHLAAEAPESPYAALAEIAATAVAPYATPAEARKTGPNRRHDTSVGVWRLCRNCQKPFAREKEIQIMARALKEAGLPHAHLALCPDCRDASQGFFRRMIG